MCKLVALVASVFMEVELKIDSHLHQLDKRANPFSRTKVSLLQGFLNAVEIIYISAGEAHCGAVDVNGSVYMWGNNAHGECG
jgi:alpha-tubulin suppressor-like RCC1 family protein